MPKLWFFEWSTSKRRAWILDEDGFTVIAPLMSLATAKAICAAHNRMIRATRETA